MPTHHNQPEIVRQGNGVHKPPTAGPVPGAVPSGHPDGLYVLFFTEMWERFSYYGMRAILILYMVAPPAQGGPGFTTAKAASIYGWYTMLVYAAAIPGGLLADRLLGHSRAAAIPHRCQQRRRELRHRWQHPVQFLRLGERAGLLQCEAHGQQHRHPDHLRIARQ